MYELLERRLNNKEIRLLKSRIRQYEKQIRTAFRTVLISGLLGGYGAAGLIVLAGNLLSEDKTPIWFTMLILFGAGTFLFLSVFRSLFRQNKDSGRKITVLRDALAGGSARVETICCKRFIEVEELEDEGACYLFEIEDKRLWGC